MTPKLAVVAYPTFSDPERAAIQSVRAQHDPQFAMLDPHFTLVFPVEAPLADVVNEARSVASATTALSVALRSARAVRDVFATGGHVFLIPEEGTMEIAALNAKLYGGVLMWAHRPDIPYVPHISVASHVEFLECESLALALARDQRDVSGWVDALTVVEVADTKVTTVATLPLGACDLRVAR